MKARYLAPLLLVAAAPPTNVQMSNGSPRAVTPSAAVDGNGDHLGVTGNPIVSDAAPVTSTTVQGTSVNVVKTTAGSLYSINVVNSTTAGFVVLYDSATTPASGTALTASLVRYCLPLAASAGLRDSFPTPLAFTAGIRLLFSTGCATYTVTSPVPVQMTGQAR